MAVMIYTAVAILWNCECWGDRTKCNCDECKALFQSSRTITPSQSLFSVSSRMEDRLMKNYYP